MKKAKLKQHLAETQKADKESGAALKNISLKNNAAKKAVKEKKRELSLARKEYKLARKAHKELACKLKELRRKHSENSKHLKRLTNKWAKANGTTTTSSVPVQKRGRGTRNKANRGIPAEPALSILS